MLDYWLKFTDLVQSGQTVGGRNFRFAQDLHLRQAEEAYTRQLALRRRGYDVERVAERVAGIYGIKVGELLARGRQPQRVSARSLFCFWAVHELGNSLASLAVRLGMSLAGVGYAVQRGEAIAQQNGYQLIQ